MVRNVKRIMPAHMRACVRPMEDLSINSRLGALTLSPDGSLIVIGLGRSVIVLREEYFEERWLKGPNPNMSDQAIVAQVNNLENDVSVVEVSATNTTIAAAGKEENWVMVAHLGNGQSGEVQAIFLSRDTQIHGIALSPDGMHIAMTGRDRKATVYDISQGEWEPVFEFDLTVYLFAYGTCVKFSPGGDLLVVGGDMRKCTVWDMKQPLGDSRLSTGSAGGASGAVSAGGGNGGGAGASAASGAAGLRAGSGGPSPWLAGSQTPPAASASADASAAGTAASGSRLLKVLGRGGYINAVCFDASGAILALTGGDWKVALYDVPNGFAPIAEIVMPVQHQHGLAISFPSSPPPPGVSVTPPHPSGHPAFAGLIVAAQSGRESGVLTLIDLATLCPLCELEGVNNIGFARGGLLYCRVGGAVHLYDINSSGDAIIPESRLGGRVRAMALNHDGSMIALARNAIVRVYASAHSGVVDELTMPGDVVALAYSPFDTPTVKVVSRLLDRYQIPHELHARIMHDAQLKGKLAALAGKRLLVYAGEPSHLAEVASVKLDGDVPAKEEEARHGLRWSADGSMVAVATATQALLVNTHSQTIEASKRRDTSSAWFSIFRLQDEFGPLAAGFGRASFYLETDVKERQLKNLMLQLGVVRVQAYAMSHDCRHVAVGGNGKLFLFDTTTQEAVFEMPNMGWVMGLAWSADDRFVGIGGHNKTVTVLDVTSGVVFADCGVPRSYWPLVLAFSGDGRVVADGNQSFAVYSCDGSRLALSKPLEAAPLLRTSSAVWSDDEPGFKAEALLVGLVSTHPQMALNALPTKNDGIYRDKGLQPLQDGSARMLDVLISRHKRALVGRLLDQVPALALLPAARQETPSFELAIRKRDLPTIHALLVASCRAPLPLRRVVARRLIPRVAADGLGAAIGTFLCDPLVGLERSGALIELATGGVRSTTLALFPSWGGVGTHIWQSVDVKHDAHSASNTLVGVHVRPKRVPLPLLTSRNALHALVHHASMSAAGHPLRVFETSCVSATVEALWAEVLVGKHSAARAVGVCAHLAAACAYWALVTLVCPHGICADADGACGLSAPLPLLRMSALRALLYLLAFPVVCVNLTMVLHGLAHAHATLARRRADAARSGAPSGGASARGWRLWRGAAAPRSAARAARHGPAAVGSILHCRGFWAQTPLGGALMLGCMLAHSRLPADAEPAPSALRMLRLALHTLIVGSLLLLVERVVYSLRGVRPLCLATVALCRSARNALPALLVGATLLCAFALSSALLLPAPSDARAHHAAFVIAVVVCSANVLLLIASRTYAELEAHARDVELGQRAALIVDAYDAMLPHRRRQREHQWQWVHVLEAAADMPPQTLIPRPPHAVTGSARAVEERLERRIDELEGKLGELRGLSDRMASLIQSAQQGRYSL